MAFQNPGGRNGQPFGRVLQLFRTPRAAWPRDVPVEQRVPPAPGAGDVVVTSIGHSSFLIATEAGNLLLDPVFSRHAGPFGILGPRRVRRPGVDRATLPPIARVLLSHNHYDHWDLPFLRWIVRRDRPDLVTPLGNAPLARKAGFDRIVELDWWGRIDGTMPVTLTPAQHFSARTPWDRNRALWGGFTIDTVRGRLYFAGDSGYGPHFLEIGQRLGPMELSLIPIGAYEPRWFMRDIHVDPAEAVLAHREVGSRLSIAMHHGTFQLTPEAIDEPVRALGQALEQAGVPAARFVVLEPGHSFILRP